MVSLPPLQLEPRLDSRVWGGTHLAPWLGLAAAPAPLAEVWLVYAENRIAGGPLAGVATEWTLGEHVRLFGAARGGLLYGTFDTRGRETNGAGTILLADVADRYSGAVPTAGVSLGGGYRWRSLNLSGGYELTHYFGGVSRPDLADDFAEGRVSRRRGDLSLDGVFLRFEYTY